MRLMCSSRKSAAGTGAEGAQPCGPQENPAIGGFGGAGVRAELPSWRADGITLLVDAARAEECPHARIGRTPMARNSATRLDQSRSLVVRRDGALLRSRPSDSNRCDIIIIVSGSPGLTGFLRERTSYHVHARERSHGPSIRRPARLRRAVSPRLVRKGRDYPPSQLR